MTDFELIIAGKICPYCNCATVLVPGDVIYPHKKNELPRPKYLDKFYYQCAQNNDHYVGTYADNTTSLGRVADAALRQWKNEGHRIFDPMWKELHLFVSQQSAYDWLSQQMAKPLSETHFGMFTIDECRQAIALCESFIQKNS